jgi:CRISPR-associated endonuclease/helicase Cas3
MLVSSRRLVDTALEYIGKLENFDRIIVLEAPTGYGKSVSAPAIAYLSNEKRFSSNFIHVLPLRAIIEDLYLCKYLYALGIKVDRCTNAPPKIFYETLAKMGINKDDVAYQMGFDYMLSDVGGKKPTYDAKIVISTLDSFAYNFLRIPVTEIYRELKHYAIPRTRIFTSSIFLDEVHMINRFDDEDSGKVLSLLKVLIEFSLKTKTPLIMSTATLWGKFRSKIIEWSNSKAVFFALSKEDGKNGFFIYVRDREFEYHAKSVRWRTNTIDEGDLVSKVMEHASKGERVLVVRDKVKDAVELFNKLDVDKKVLIHGRLCIGDREKALESSKDAKVVIATPVVEAGVDWDFDVGFRDATNIPSAIQVFGRVCRNRADCEGSVYLVKTGESSKEFVEFIEKSRGIDWRIPYSYTNEKGEEVKGYQELLELTKTAVDENKDAERFFKGLISPIALPSIYINDLLWGSRYTILKEPLTQFYVYGWQSLVSTKTIQDVILGTFVYTYDIVKKSSRCVEKAACVVEINDGLDFKDYNPPTPSLYELQRKCAEHAYSLKGRIILAGYVLKEGCYEKGVGFV